MLLGALNYGSNLGFFYTFLLSGIGLATMLQTWRNLLGLGLTTGRCKPVFAGQMIQYIVFIENNSRFERPAIELQVGESEPMQADIPGISLAGSLIDKGKQELILQVNKNNTAPGQLVYRDKRLRLESAGITARLDSQDAHITLNATELQGDEPIRINGQVNWKDNRLSSPEFHIMAAGGEISGIGEGDRFSLTWESLNLQSPLLIAYFPHPLYSKTSGSLDLVVSYNDALGLNHWVNGRENPTNQALKLLVEAVQP